MRYAILNRARQRFLPLQLNHGRVAGFCGFWGYMGATVSGAGVGRIVDLAGWRARGYWLCSKYVIPAMLSQGGGSTIHVASRPYAAKGARLETL